MSSDFTGLSGFDELSAALAKYSRMADEESVSKAVKAGADAFVKDARALPRPRSNIGGTHTHMLDTITTKRDGRDWLAGWGKYYGRMVETGTRKMSAQPHLVPTWEKGKEKYTRIMAETLLGG